MIKQKQMYNSILATRYAQAFLSLYKDQISVDGYRQVRTAIHALSADKRLMSSIQIPFMYIRITPVMVKKIVQLLNLPTYFDLLFTVLIQHKQLGIINEVLKKFIVLFEQYAGVIYCVLKSSHELPQQQIDDFIKYFSYITDKKVVYDTEIDPTLIAGVRLQSNTIVWESSVRKQLQQLESAVHKG